MAVGINNQFYCFMKFLFFASFLPIMILDCSSSKKLFTKSCTPIKTIESFWDIRLKSGVYDWEKTGGESADDILTLAYFALPNTNSHFPIVNATFLIGSDTVAKGDLTGQLNYPNTNPLPTIQCIFSNGNCFSFRPKFGYGFLYFDFDSTENALLLLYSKYYGYKRLISRESYSDDNLASKFSLDTFEVDFYDSPYSKKYLNADNLSQQIIFGRRFDDRVHLEFGHNVLEEDLIVETPPISQIITPIRIPIGLSLLAYHSQAISNVEVKLLEKGRMIRFRPDFRYKYCVIDFVNSEWSITFTNNPYWQK